MKNSGIEWIGEIPDSWKIMRLKDVVESHFGGCWGEEASEDDGILCIRIADFDFDRQTIKSSASTKRQYSISQLEKGVLQDGDLILEKSGGGEKTSVGRVVVFEQKMFPCKAMFANFSECLRLKRNLHNEKYCAYLLKALYYTKDMSCFYHQTTGIQNLDVVEYLSMNLCFPSRKEQDIIVACLNKKLAEVDKLIEVQQAQIEKLKEYKQSVITEAVTKGLAPTAPMKDSGVEWIGKIPEGWEVCRIKNLPDYSVENCFIDGDWIESPDIADSGIRYLTTGNVGDGQFKYQGNGYITKETFDKLNCKFAYPGDWIIARLNAPYGRSCILPNDEERYVLAVDIVILRTKYNKKYLCYFTQCPEFQHTVEDFARGTAMKRISRTNLGAVKMVLPSIDEQNTIADYLDDKCAKIDKLIALKQSKIEKLQEYKKSMIYEYVTGKREVM